MKTKFVLLETLAVLGAYLLYLQGIWSRPEAELLDSFKDVLNAAPTVSALKAYYMPNTLLATLALLCVGLYNGLLFPMLLRGRQWAGLFMATLATVTLHLGLGQLVVAYGNANAEVFRLNQGMGLFHRDLPELLSSVLLFSGAQMVFGVLREILRSTPEGGRIKQTLRLVGPTFFVVMGLWLMVFIAFFASDLFTSLENVPFLQEVFFMVPALGLHFALGTAYLLPYHWHKGKRASFVGLNLLLWLFFVALCSPVLSGFMLFSENAILTALPFAAVAQGLVALALPAYYPLLRPQIEQALRLANTEADLAALRAQINPHFLFNALNTLYATALQEDSPRTAQAIQQLGDMMRFVLRGQRQTHIPLAQEVEYLNHYLDLQKLRLGTHSGIDLRWEAEGEGHAQAIAPMLLVPLVENAFKHGISLREKSWVHLHLRSEHGKVYFTASNSVHAKPTTDHERDNHGIGLANVRQRLQLIYPHRHRLSIVQSAREFRVELEVSL